jgi:DNA-directed RNA polymerase subunit RPC12/RpoP
MTIEFGCPDCSREYRVKDGLAGRGVTCKDCGSKISVPNPDAEDDEWDDYDEEPAPAPVRRRPKKSSGGSKKKKAAASSGAAWKKIMGPLAILIGIVGVGFSVMELLGGNGRAVRGIFGGCFFAGVGFKWLRDG